MQTKIIFEVSKIKSKNSAWHLKEFLYKLMDYLIFKKMDLTYKIKDDNTIELIFTLNEEYIPNKGG